MSRKIQEFFKAIPTMDYNKMEVPKEYQECQVIVKDIRQQIGNGRVGEFKIQRIANKAKKLDEKSKTIEHKCKICEKKFAFASNLSVHMMKLHPEQLKGLLECQICQQKFIKKHKLEQHMKVKHFDGKIQLFECDFCGKLMKTKGVIRNHIKMHLPTVNCDICHAELKQTSIKGHMKDSHTGDQKFQCELCPKTFKTRKILWSHLKTHNKRFQCTACMKTFPIKFHLLKHQKEVHENPGSNSCEVCDKKFNTITNLRIHLKIHDRYRSKRFKCDRCALATDNKDNYKKHQITHVRRDEKFAAMKNPLKCPKCSNFSRNKDALRIHLKDVHPDESFQCDLCGRYLKAFQNLKNHLKLHQLNQN